MNYPNKLIIIITQFSADVSSCSAAWRAGYTEERCRGARIRADSCREEVSKLRPVKLVSNTEQVQLISDNSVYK